MPCLVSPVDVGGGWSWALRFYGSVAFVAGGAGKTPRPAWFPLRIWAAWIFPCPFCKTRAFAAGGALGKRTPRALTPWGCAPGGLDFALCSFCETRAFAAGGVLGKRTPRALTPWGCAPGGLVPGPYAFVERAPSRRAGREKLLAPLGFSCGCKGRPGFWAPRFCETRAFAAGGVGPGPCVCGLVAFAAGRAGKAPRPAWFSLWV